MFRAVRSTIIRSTPSSSKSCMLFGCTLAQVFSGPNLSRRRSVELSRPWPMAVAERGLTVASWQTIGLPAQVVGVLPTGSMSIEYASVGGTNGVGVWPRTGLVGRAAYMAKPAAAKIVSTPIAFSACRNMLTLPLDS